MAFEIIKQILLCNYLQFDVNQFILYLLQFAYTATTQNFYYAVQSTFYIVTTLFY